MVVYFYLNILNISNRPRRSAGDCIFVDRADKPNSVPILPTEGGSRIEYPEFIEGLQSFDFAQDAQF